jgi:dynein heavy chain
LKKIVGDFRETMPIVEALGNPYLDKIHWDEVRIILNITEEFLLEERQFCLGDLIALDVSAKQEEIVHISVTATQEAKLYA